MNSPSGSSMITNRLVLMIFVLSVLVCVPMVALAAAPRDPGTLGGVLGTFQDLANSVIAFFIVVAIAVFFWGLITYLAAGAGMETKGAINLMIWGIVALFVMVSVWGLINLLQRSFSVQGNAQAPTIYLPKVGQ